MISTVDFYQAKKTFPKKYRDKIMAGHMSKEMFSEEELKKLEVKYPKLVARSQDVFGEIQYHLFGYDEHEDIGIACVVIEQEFYIMPEHNMRVSSLIPFIRECLKNHPEIKI